MAMFSQAGVDLSKEKTIKCPFCGETVIHEDLDFYRCPNCSCEIWPKEQDTNPYLGMWEAYFDFIHMPIRPGGGEKKGRARKNRVGPRVISERYLLT